MTVFTIPEIVPGSVYNNRFVQSRIVAFEAVELPSPLIAEKHEIEVNIRHNLLEVSEVLFVTNPSRKTYVGEQLEDKSRVTLRTVDPADL